jgi:uncharacterized repeat protein (TIGR03803 family)
MILLATMFLIVTSATAQTYRVIHTFMGNPQGDEGSPHAGLTIDSAGNLYGTTSGAGSDGSVFEMVKQGDSWKLQTLYHFNDADGRAPGARVVFGPDGALYGTTEFGGPAGSGTVFRVAQQPVASCHRAPCLWKETILHAFGTTSDPADGYVPRSDLLFDSTGNIFGTTQYGGDKGAICYGTGCGTIFELSQSQGTWSRTTLYSFVHGNDHHPIAGLFLDGSGNLDGTSYDGVGNGMYGAVFQLTPGTPNWSRTVLHSFSQAEGWGVWGDLISDSAGNLYGAAANDGAGSGGMVFELSPTGSGWDFQVLYSFPAVSQLDGGPFGALTMDRLGNLYGTTYVGGVGLGSVFKLTPSNGTWIYSALYKFTDGSDGGYPISNVVIDDAGNLYGTTGGGGYYGGYCVNLGCGVVWEITP